MPRITRSSQKQIEFRCRKTRSQQKEIEGAIETSQSKPTRVCSISPRKRHDPVKGKLKKFSFLYSTSVHPQIWKSFVTNAAILDNFTFQEFHIMKSAYSHFISQATRISIFPAQQSSTCWTRREKLRDRWNWSTVAVFFFPYNSAYKSVWGEISLSPSVHCNSIRLILSAHSYANIGFLVTKAMTIHNNLNS